LALIVLILSLSIGFIKYTSHITKNKYLYAIGINTTSKNKYKLSSIFYRYNRIINKKLSLQEFHDKFWSLKVDPKNPYIPKGFDPYNPNSGWGSRGYRTIYPLIGNNVEIVPIGSKGYLLDSASKLNIWNRKLYSQTKIYSLPANKCDTLFFHVYCYVSDEFNGNKISIYLNGKNSSKIEKEYDKSYVGIWQEIKITKCVEADDTINAYLFWNSPFKNKSDIKGYVIFAYPTYEIISQNESISSYTLHSSGVFSKQHLNYKKYSKAEKSDYQKTSIINGLQNIPLDILLQKVQDPDPIRNWVKSVFNEDTTYYGYTADINFPHDPKDAMHGRTDRWKFAWELYTKEYNWYEKIIGHGFDYLNWYGYYFQNDKTKTDWPHNPFLSVLLYSGIIGLVLYLLLLYKVIAIYLKYVKEYYLLFIFWGITFFFSFFSANSPFNPPVMGFFMMLPFFIDYIHKKEEKEQNKKLA